MRPHVSNRWLVVAIVGLALAAPAADGPAASPAFTKKPVVTRDGDSYKIQFTVDRETDVAVAVEDAHPSTSSGRGGRVIRHLAAGALGRNAPAPLQKNSLAQELVWDGKDDGGCQVSSVKGKSEASVPSTLDPRPSTLGPFPNPRLPWPASLP